MWAGVRGVGAALVALLLWSGPAAVAADSGSTGESGPTEPFTLSDPRIVESSGLAASRAHEGVYWTHNDSGYAPVVYAVDSTTGRTLAAITLTGVEGRDLEAVSVGPDGNVYVGDIGDNFGGRWPEVWIYRFPEPEQLQDQTLQPTRFTVRYADGPRDAESLAVHPVTGRVYIVGKNEDGDGLYAGPRELTTQGVNVFQRVAEIDLWATDAAFSPDGTRLAVRGYFGGIMYDWNDGAPKRLGRLQVPIQRQGESVAFTPDGRRLLYGSEGANSEVRPVELVGDQRPENVLKAEEKARRDGGSGAREGAGGAAGEDAERPSGSAVLGAVTIAAVVVGWMGLRRLRRR
ncbi:hypothetical protein GL263_01620 [Streptomyces durbertensis]|uniref:WD40 repeat domain-containing protein n=1 Tax=Streptomyces durbertensis TaxID=2448886 RepID=A0ABR6ECN9_9ACTN|nr:hypothetical protein [Streptomyces durbertensis]MBB1242279.1 hypothetical protein [Streptomyces durbertensis]